MSEPNKWIKKERDHNINLAPKDKDWIKIVNDSFNRRELAFSDLVQSLDELKDDIFPNLYTNNDE